MRFELTDPAPAKENAGARGVQWKIRAVRWCWEQPRERGSGWECCQPGLLHSALLLGEHHLCDFCFDLGFYLTDYSLPPHLLLFNCFFLLLPCFLTPPLPPHPFSSFFPPHSLRVLSHPSPSARPLCPHSPPAPHSSLVSPHRLAALFSPEPWQQGL